MTPVISPWVFYLMPVCEKFAIATWMFFCFTLLCAVIFLEVLVSEYGVRYSSFLNS